MLEIPFYTCVPKITIIWCTVPEIRSETGRIFWYFGPFFALSAPWQHGKSKFWKTERNTWRYYHFTHAYHKWLTCPKNKNSEKMKKISRHIIFLQKCTKNHDHMLYCSWDMARDGCNCYFLFWAIFCPFTPLTAQKIKISKKWKEHLEISSFYTCVPKIMIGWCTVPEKWCAADGRTDGEKKWHTEVGIPPKNWISRCKKFHSV